MTELENKIFDIVRKIPPGKVMTYGQVAAAIGDAHLARVVGNTMHRNPVPYFELAEKAGFNCKEIASASAAAACETFEPVPCHRVVNAAGKMASNFGLGGPEIQAAMLKAEGIKISGCKVDLKKYAFHMIKEKQ